MKTTTLSKLLPPEAISEIQYFIDMNPGLNKTSPEFSRQLKAILSKYKKQLLNQRVDSDFLAYSIINAL